MAPELISSCWISPFSRPTAAKRRSGEKSTEVILPKPPYSGTGFAVLASMFHHWADPLSLEVRRFFPSGEKATTKLALFRTARTFMVSTSQTFTVWLRQPAAMVLLSGEKVKLPKWSDSKLVTDSIGSFPARFQNRTGLSRLPLARRLPSGENASDQTAPICPRKVCGFCTPVSASHSLMVSSELPVARLRPSGEKASDKTGRLPRLKLVESRVAAFQTLTVPWPSPTASLRPSGENSSARISRGSRRNTGSAVLLVSQSLIP